MVCAFDTIRNNIPNEIEHKFSIRPNLIIGCAEITMNNLNEIIVLSKTIY
jgi:hypothetical protein